MTETTPSPAHTGERPLLEVDDLQVHFPVTEGALMRRRTGTVRAVDGISFELRRGETLGLVGESGCGKSTTALAILRMVDATGGRIVFDGEEITHHSQRQMRPLRRRLQMVYQDPYGSLNPRMRVRDLIGEPLVIHKVTADRTAYRRRVAELMDLVGLLPAMAERYPHEFSGGQRQRIGIARALALEPDVLLCDEPVSALDVSIQAQIINLFEDLQKDLGLTYLFISHDLSVVRHICDRVAVMYLGRLVEVASRDLLFSAPRHPYTRALLDAVPVPDPARRPTASDSGPPAEPPSPQNPPDGCRFHPRCALREETCVQREPRLAGAADHAVACWVTGEAADAPETSQ